jgi:hypothetical protein
MRAMHEEIRNLLAEWPGRLRAIPHEKPLDEGWMPGASPIGGGTTHPDGQPRGLGLAPYWWRWSIANPDRLVDAATGQALPDAFPYRHHAAMCAYRATLGDREALRMLADGYEQTGDEACATAIAALLAAFAPIYPSLPITLQEDANPRTMPAYGPELLGRRYCVRVNMNWRDSAALFHWLLAYRRIRSCAAVTASQDEAVRDLTRAVIEFNGLPNLLYFNDKYHNSLMDYYQAFLLASSIWGQTLEVRDLISGRIFRGGDLGQLAINGPAGLRMFMANSFDREGVYWELSSSYTGYVFARLEEVLPVLVGYSDPAGYAPEESVRVFYEPICCFAPATALPDLWRAALSQTRLALSGGQLLPTNDANPLNAVNPEWLDQWAGVLRSDRVARAARQARAFVEKRSPFVLEPGSTLMAASGAVTLRGPANRLNLHLDWHGVQDYHSHLDPLNLVLSTEGHTTLDDLGYHLGHPLRHLVSERTAAHNTVTVDRTDSARHAKGVLHHVLLDDVVQYVDASVPGAYPQTELYRRAVVLVADRYVVDIFRVTGGASHEYALVSRADHTTSTLPLEFGNGTVARPDKPYAGYDELDCSAASPASPYEVMHHPAFADAGGSFRVDWIQRDRPDLTTRIHHIGQAGAQAILAKVPYKDRRQGDAVKDAEILLVRRSGRPGLHSTFVSVIETLSDKAQPLETVVRLEVESPQNDAVAVEIRHADGTDLIIQAIGAGPHRVPGRDITLEGSFAVLRVNRDGFVRVTQLAGRLTTPWGAAELPTGSSARVEKVDFATGQLRLDAPLGEGRRLAGRFVAIRGSAGRITHWRVADADKEGHVLTLDIEQSGLLALRGTIEGVENTRTFSCGLRLPDPPELGSTLRIGRVGDFGCLRHRIEYAAQTGLPLRFGGSTTATSPRELRIGLDRAARLEARHVGQTFWVSGIEPGDEVFFDPSASVQWSHHQGKSV